MGRYILRQTNPRKENIFPCVCWFFVCPQGQSERTPILSSNTEPNSILSPTGVATVTAPSSINTHRELVSRLARACGCRALLIDYRLGPEHRFPAAVDDALACYSRLLDQAIAPGRIAIAGDSAGGGLTLATLLAAREAGLPMPAAAVGLSAWTDLSVSGDSITSRQEADPMLTGDQLRQFATWYLGEDGDPRNPLASPLFASLAGLPPLLLQVGSEEVLLDDTLRLADNARAAGVEVCVEQWDEMFHVWQALAAMLDEGQKAIDRIGEFLREKMG